MSKSVLRDKDKKVLGLVVESFVRNGRPVSSGALCQTRRISASPATLRNIMVKLEAMGFLSQPHTSAGRLPTDKGLRHYVGGLLADKALPEERVPLIQEEFVRRTADLDSLLIQACRILADSSDNLGFVISPHIFRLPFEHLRFVKISDRRILVILVTPFHMVLTETLESSLPLTQAELDRAAQYVNQSFRGKTILAVRDALIRELPKYRVKYEDTLDKLLDLLKTSVDREQGENRIFLQGTARLLGKGGLSDVGKLAVPLPEVRGEGGARPAALGFHQPGQGQGPDRLRGQPARTSRIVPWSSRTTATATRSWALWASSGPSASPTKGSSRSSTAWPSGSAWPSRSSAERSAYDGRKRQARRRDRVHPRGAARRPGNRLRIPRPPRGRSRRERPPRPRDRATSRRSSRRRRPKAKELRKELDELKETNLRRLADMENLRKRFDREKTEFQQYALSGLLLELLGIGDNFERALQSAAADPEGKSFREGVELILRMFQGLLARNGVRPIELKDRAFDPNFHHAMVVEESDNVEEPEVVEELQKGYLHHDRLLRPTLVKVVVPKKGQ